MAIAVVLGLSSAIILIQPVPVDFKLKGVSPPPAVSVQPLVQSTAPAGQQDGATQLHPVARPHQAMAIGFGRDVPLEFAVRQVVPRTRHVEYGDTVDRQLRVSWQGGRPWQQVLHAVLEPIGLHVVTSGRTVKITE